MGGGARPAEPLMGKGEGALRTHSDTRTGLKIFKIITQLKILPSSPPLPLMGGSVALRTLLLLRNAGNLNN